MALIDTKVKQADGIDTSRRALAAGEQTKVDVLTYYLDPDERRRAYRAGVNGYLLKTWTLIKVGYLGIRRSIKKALWSRLWLR